MNKINHILILFVLLIGLSACKSSVPPSSNMEEVHIQSPDSDAENANNQNTAERVFEYALYRKNGETDTLIGNILFPEDSLYYTDNKGRISPSLLTMSDDGNDAFLGVLYPMQNTAPYYPCRTFRLHLDTGKLTDYGVVMSIFPLQDAVFADGYLYPRDEATGEGDADGSIAYTYFHAETMQEQTITFYPEVEHERLRSVAFRHNPDNGDWYYFFSIPRYGLENPKSFLEAYRDIELYCTVFDSGGNARVTHATTLDWPIMQGLPSLTGEFIVWEDMLYTSYVSKWADEFQFAEEISLIEYNPYTNAIREIAAYPVSYFRSEEMGKVLTCVKDGALTFSLLKGNDTWEKHQISVTDGAELITPITIERPKSPRIYVGDTADGGYYYMIESGNA